MERALVIARTFRDFFSEIPERFPNAKSVIGYRTGKVIVDGTQYIFVANERSMRGVRPSRVEIWGAFPDWWDERASQCLEAATAGTQHGEKGGS